jgi:hypothetical protein
MTEEDEEFNRIEREASLRKAAVAATVQKPLHPEIRKMYEDYFDKCFREYSAAEREWTGLTDEEIDELHNEIKVRLMGTFKIKDIYLALEAKLKEKNEM